MKYKVIVNFVRIHEDNKLFKEPVDLVKDEIIELTEEQANYINKVCRQEVLELLEEK